MAALPRCLCFLTILWIAVSRPSTAILTGSPYSSTGTARATSPKILEQVRRAVQSGDFPTVERLCRQGLAETLSRQDPANAAKFQSCLGSVAFSRFEYGAALSSYLQARKLAEASGNTAELAAILFNLSSLYQQVWDLPSALSAAEQGRTLTSALPDVEYRPQLLLQLGRLQPREQGPAAIEYFRQGIQAAHLQRASAMEARGLDLLGERYRDQGDLTAAAAAHAEAYRIRRATASPEVAFSLAYLGALRLAQASMSRNARDRKERLREALEFTQEALDLQPVSRASSFPHYALLHQRGRIRAQQGRTLSALEDLSGAISEAQIFRGHFPPAASSFKGANSGLEETLFDDFVEQAASYAVATGSLDWARKSFVAAEINRAASLRQDLAITDVWRRKLPAQYWETLAALHTEESRLLADGTSRSNRSDALELRLSEMESQAGLYLPQQKFERFDALESLKHISEGLGDSEVLLSFHLGERRSFLWAVTRDSLRLYSLAPRDRIRESVREFQNQVQSGQSGTERLGQQLYKDLFGVLGPEAGKTEWLLSIEDALFELPFAALVPDSGAAAGRTGGRGMYLIERHWIQIVPSAFLLKRGTSKGIAHGRMVVVGDPVYNTADLRWRYADPAREEGFSGFPPFHIRPFGAPRHENSARGPAQLNRLAGSAEEALSVAQAWAPGTTTLLTGSDAKREHLLQALNPAPAVLHLATHVLASRDSHRKSFLALGLGEDSQPELLSESDIGALNVPNSLVVMTGCSTAAGDILAGAGLQGLTAAWAVAGARGVVATQWPVRDSSGDFLAGFYRALSSEPTAGALQKTQVAMIHSGSAFALPSAWASYQLYGGAR